MSVTEYKTAFEILKAGGTMLTPQIHREMAKRKAMIPGIDALDILVDMAHGGVVTPVDVNDNTRREDLQFQLTKDYEKTDFYQKLIKSN
jgi:hypothetical protein